MKHAVYYNDNEPFVCDWLENLIREKLLPDGVVDRRPIQEVEPRDVQAFTQCHFFAGIGGWPYALQLAGWGDRPVWTGSCPCQPFSAAGQRKSHADDRHLWPAWFRLIQECYPVTVFGEQVSGAAGLGWLDAVAMDLEAADYAVGACVLGAHSVGAPHLRQRLWFVADSEGQRNDTGASRHTWWNAPQSYLSSEIVADANRAGLQEARSELCTAGIVKHREPDHWTTEPAVGRVAHGIPARMGRLRAYGNAIVPQVAAAFVRAYLECVA